MLATATFVAGCAELDGALNFTASPSRETVSVPVIMPTNAPPPPASLLGLAAPPRPRPRVTPTRAPGPGSAPGTEGALDSIGHEGGQEPTLVAAAAPVAPVPTGATAANGERLLGLSEASLEIWLGPPQQRLDVAPARVWRYVESQCRLDTFLYLDMQTKEFHVLHYEVASNDGSAQRKDECLRQILVRNGGPLPRSGPVQAENRPH